MSWVFLKDVVITGILRSLSEPGFIKEIVHTEILRSLSELGFVKDIVGTELLASTWRELDLMCLRDT